MNAHNAICALTFSLTKDATGKYRLPSRKVFLKVRLLGFADAVQFTTRDNVAFQIDECGLTVKGLKTGSVRSHFGWTDIESIVAGEPESDNTPLFQG
jgi:hypothetical protein